MPDRPVSPYQGLDKALLRSTRRREPEPVEPEPVVAEESSPPDQEIPDAARSVAVETPSAAGVSATEDASKHDSMIAYDAAVIEAIRKAVKVSGREVSFARLTLTEKQQIADIVYTYKRQGKRTSENEISRIALNYILRDYKESGSNSILARVIEALLA